MLTTQPNKEHATNNILSLFVLWAFAAPAVKLMKMFSICIALSSRPYHNNKNSAKQLK